MKYPITVALAVKNYEVSERTVRRWIKDGTLACQKGMVPMLTVELLAEQWHANKGKRKARPRVSLLV